MSVWMDAASPSTFTMDGGTSRVTSWASRVNSTSAVQATTAKMPLLIAGAQNGLPGVRFDGADDGMLFGSFPAGLPNTGTIYAVVSGFDGTLTYRTIAGSNAWRFQSIDFQTPSGDGGLTYLPSAGVHQIDIVNTVAYSSSSTNTARIDGAVANSGYTATAAAVNAVTAMSLGYDISGTGGADYSNLSIHEFLYYPVVHSAAEQSVVRAYLKAKWGL